MRVQCEMQCRHPTSFHSYFVFFSSSSEKASERLGSSCVPVCNKYTKNTKIQAIIHYCTLLNLQNSERQRSIIAILLRVWTTNVWSYQRRLCVWLCVCVCMCVWCVSVSGTKWRYAWFDIRESNGTSVHVHVVQMYARDWPRLRNSHDVRSCNRLCVFSIYSKTTNGYT